MKKLISFLLIAAIALGLCACGEAEVTRSEEYDTAVTHAKSWISSLKAYDTARTNADNDPGNYSMSMRAMSAETTALENLVDLYYDAYAPLSEEEKTAFMDWLSSYNARAYSVMNKFIATKDVTSVLK